MSLEWGTILFDGPYPIKRWEPLSNPGIYAIMKKPDAYNKPHTYHILYFGESGNLSELESYKLHSKYECWVKEAGSRNNTYIGVHLMPNSTSEKRKRLADALIKTFSPVCNIEDE